MAPVCILCRVSANVQPSVAVPFFADIPTKSVDARFIPCVTLLMLLHPGCSEENLVNAFLSLPDHNNYGVCRGCVANAARQSASMLSLNEKLFPVLADGAAGLSVSLASVLFGF